MMRTTCVTAVLILGFTGMAIAASPMGPGATGGPGDSAEKNLRPGAPGESRVLRQDGTAADHADINVRESGAKTSELKRDAAAPTGVGATGAPGSAGKAAGSLPEEVRAAPK